jgi:hypothetical protein
LSDGRFEVLPGLLGFGPPAIPFPANNSGASEGFIVRFCPSSSEAWIANFRCGETSHNAVYLHPDDKRVVVIAGGADYLVCPETKSLEACTTGNISYSYEIPDLRILLFGDDVHFWAEDEVGRKWTTPGEFWDGIEVIKIWETVLIGRHYSALDEMYHDFKLDLTTGDIILADFRQIKSIKRETLIGDSN